MCTCPDTPVPPFATRRQLLGGMAALAALASGRQALARSEPLPDNRIAPAAALQRLQEGNARYAAGRPLRRDASLGRAARVHGQRPFAAVLSCADSRVAPELAFDQGPGSLFVVRLAGNFVNGDALASLEYAVRFLGVPLIMVLGHSNCGAVAAAIDVVQQHTQLPGHLPALVEAIRPAVESAQRRSPGDLLATATAHNIQLNVARLATAAPVLAQEVDRGTLAVVGGLYGLADGKVVPV